MPILRMNKQARGIQTWDRARRLLPELQEAEFEYLTIKDYYVNELAALAQFEEALKDAKRRGDLEEIKHIGSRLKNIHDKLTGLRADMKDAGELSWCKAFHKAAWAMLSKEAFGRLEKGADDLMNRPRHEIIG